MQTPTTQAPEIVEDAIDALSQSAGIEGTFSPNPQREVDGTLELRLANKRYRFHCEIQPAVRTAAEIMDLRARALIDVDQILITRAMSYHLALTCRNNGVQFFDTVGNAYIRPYNDSNVLIFVAGNKAAQADINKKGTISTPSAVKLIVSLIAEPAVLNQPYREMASAAEVAMGSVSLTINALEERGFLGKVAGKRVWSKKEKLISEWAAGYAGRLRPKLQATTFSVPNLNELRDTALDPNMAVWGGEEAAARLTRFLKPEVVTIYADREGGFVSNLVRQFRLRKDPDGQLQIIQPFWDLKRFASPTKCAPQLSVYADLLLSGDSRNIEAAQYIHRELVL